MNKRRGRPPKGDVTKTERMYWRLTAEQKALFNLAAETCEGGTTTFWEPIIQAIAENTLRLKEGKITQFEFKEIVGSQITEFIVSSERENEGES